MHFIYGPIDMKIDMTIIWMDGGENNGKLHISLGYYGVFLGLC